MIAIVKKVNSIKNMPSNVYRIKLKSFKQKVNIRVEKGRYMIKTADNSRELLQVLRLRYEVFNLKNKKIFKIDIDKFDKDADHLLIYDRETGKMVGTYRVLCSKFTDRFYSETEFDISTVKQLSGEKIELGRACIRPEYRNGATLMLLWRAISEYVEKVRADYLFGCSSVFTTDPLEVAFVTDYLLRNYSSETVYARAYRTVENLEKHVQFLRENNIDTSAAEKLVPPLLKMYLSAGSRVCSLPSLDEEFGCVDFFTILDTGNLTDTFRRKYRKDV